MKVFPWWAVVLMFVITQKRIIYGGRCVKSCNKQLGSAIPRNINASIAMWIWDFQNKFHSVEPRGYFWISVSSSWGNIQSLPLQIGTRKSKFLISSLPNSFGAVQARKYLTEKMLKMISSRGQTLCIIRWVSTYKFTWARKNERAEL